MACCSNSANNPNAPEYGKGHKPQHNNGCGCSCANNTDDDDDSDNENNIRVVRNRLTRSDFNE